MKRTDIHRPTVIVPEDYDFIAFEHVKSTGDIMGDAYENLANRKIIRAHMERTGGKYSHHDHGGQCGICGNANAIYTALFHHKPTNTYIRTGQDCAEKLDAGVSFNKFIEGVKADKAFRAGKRKAEAILTEAGLAAAWAIACAAEEDLPCDPRKTRTTTGWDEATSRDDVVKTTTELYFEEATIRDIVGKLVKYGEISQKQTAFVRKLLDAIPLRAERAAARQAEAAAAKPVPVTDKRITIKGKVLTVRAADRDDPWGTTKILVQHADGWKVWGSLPSIPLIVEISGRSEMTYTPIDRGDEIQFDAKVTVSKDDPKFGFYKRPTKALNFTKAQETK
jgi:hypothetical protein